MTSKLERIIPLIKKIPGNIVRYIIYAEIINNYLPQGNYQICDAGAGETATFLPVLGPIKSTSSKRLYGTAHHGLQDDLHQLGTGGQLVVKALSEVRGGQTLS